MDPHKPPYPTSDEETRFPELNYPAECYGSHLNTSLPIRNRGGSQGGYLSAPHLSAPPNSRSRSSSVSEPTDLVPEGPLEQIPGTDWWSVKTECGNEFWGAFPSSLDNPNDAIESARNILLASPCGHEEDIDGVRTVLRSFRSGCGYGRYEDETHIGCFEPLHPQSQFTNQAVGPGSTYFVRTLTADEISGKKRLGKPRLLDLPREPYPSSEWDNYLERDRVYREEQLSKVRSRKGVELLKSNQTRTIEHQRSITNQLQGTTTAVSDCSRVISTIGQMDGLPYLNTVIQNNDSTLASNYASVEDLRAALVASQQALKCSLKGIKKTEAGLTEAATIMDGIRTRLGRCSTEVSETGGGLVTERSATIPFLEKHVAKLQIDVAKAAKSLCDWSD